MVPAGNAANASSVGAKTVNGPSPLSTSTKSAAFTAATNVVKDHAATAVSTISLLCPPAKTALDVSAVAVNTDKNVLLIILNLFWL